VTTELKLPPVYQLGYVVGNVDRTCTFYQSTYGVGPFTIIDEVDMEGAILRGKPISTKIKVALAKSDNVELEFIQPLEGENLYTEFLAAKGDGIHHLAFLVDDMDVWKREFAIKGYEPVFHHDMGVVEFAYFDTSMFGGLMLELLRWK
jgi:catechol 2,3-dioxygenase-like lactoylglutathione lyase family enzyme